MKKIILIAFLHLLSLSLITAQTTLLTEDFETDGEGSRYNSTAFSDCVNSDYFLRTNDNAPFSSCGTFGSVLSNVQGSWFWVCEDIESIANPNATFSILTLNPLNVSGYSSITVSLYMATGRTGTQWEWADSVKIQTSWDGGAYTTIGQFVGDAEFGGYLRQDTNLDGVADGGAPDISSTFGNFTFNVPGIGTNLSVRVRLAGLDGSEEFAFDKITVQGSSAPPANYTPILANLETVPLVFTEGEPAINVTGTITVTDPDDTELDSAVVQICSGFTPAEDVLSFSSSGGITGTFDNTSGILKLKGNASLADYQSVLRSVQYQNTNTDNPSNVQREICFTLNDGTDDSNTQSRIINIMDVIADAVCIPFAESFETDGEGITYVSNTFDDSPSPNFFFRTNTQPAGHAEAVTGIDASYFWACEDVMGGSNGATPGIIEFAPMIITGNNSFTFQVELGTSNSTGTRWEQTDNILIQYNIDGGEWNTFGLFQGDNPFGGDLRVDTDNDTITAGPYEATVPNGSVSDFLFAFNGTGDELKVRMVFVLQGGSEELVFDNIRLSGDVPVVASCKNISVYLDETGYVSIHPEDVMAGSPDDCGIDSIAVTPWEFTCDSAGDNTVLLTVYDNVGNTSTCEATVTVLDTVKPEAICQDITVYLDTDGEASLVPSDIDGGSTDACGIYDLTASDTLFYCSDIGTTQVLLTVEDRSGNSSVCSALVTISDTVSLVIDCPPDQTETIDENCRFEIPDYRPLAGVTNSCGIDTVYQTPVPGTFVGVGDTTITLTARAGSKNASCSFNLNVTGVTANFTSDVTSGCTMTEISFSDLSVDAAKWWWDFGDGSPVDTTQNPTHVYIQPGTYTVSLKVNNLNGCSDSISELSYITINPPLANFSATPVTACTVPHTVFFTDQSVLPDTWNWDFGDGNTSTAQNPIHTYTTLGTFEVILLVTDTLTGCTDTAKTIIEINDNVPPVINCPSDTFVFANADCQGELGDYTSLANVYDDCATTPLVTQFPSPGTFFNDSIQVTLIAADNQDNKDSCVFTVTVTDTTSPSANCMNIQVFLNENGEAFLTPTDIDGGSTDNCGIDTLFSDITNFSSADLGENMVTLTVTDKSGNSSWCQSIVTVKDTLGPVLNANEIEIFLNENGEYTLTEDDIDSIVGTPTDNIDSQDEIETGVYPVSFNCVHVGKDPVIQLVARDKSGNESKEWVTIIVSDTLAPVFETIDDVEITIESGICDTTTNVEYPEIMVNDNCGAEVELLTGLGAGGIFPVGTSTETWVATDAAGNTDTLSFDIVVFRGNDLPTLDSIADVAVNEDSDAVLVKLTGITYGEDCSKQKLTLTSGILDTTLVNSLTVDYISGDSTGTVKIVLAPEMSGTTEIMVTVNDEGGAQVSQTFMLTVNPVNDAPFVVTPIPDQTVHASYVLEIPVSSVLGVLFDDVDDDELEVTVMVEGTDTLPVWAALSGDTLLCEPTIADTGCVNIVVMATDTSGTTATDTFEICVDGYPVSVDDLNANLPEVQMYPNPASGEVNISFSSGIHNIDLNVIDITGRVVLQKQYPALGHVVFDMSGKVSGMYFVHINIDGRHLVKKLVIDRKR